MRRAPPVVEEAEAGVGVGEEAVVAGVGVGVETVVAVEEPAIHYI